MLAGEAVRVTAEMNVDGMVDKVMEEVVAAVEVMVVAAVGHGLVANEPRFVLRIPRPPPGGFPDDE